MLSAVGRDATVLAETVCVRDLAARLADRRPSDFFAAPLATVRGVEPALADYMGIPTSGYDRPIFLGVGLQDRDVPPSSSLRLNDALLAAGQPVELHVYAGDDHSSAVLASIPDSTPFLQRLMS